MAHQGATIGYAHEAAFESSMLKVDDIHSIHYEQYGSKNGLPVVFLHGGPGGQTGPSNTKFFNPVHYRVVLLDQRGAGKSQPWNEIRENTSQHLVADIEKLREHLDIKKWHMVFGGSWGSTLGLLYTQTHPERVKCLVLRGVVTFRKSEVAHSRRGGSGAGNFQPEAYEKFLGFLPAAERHDPISAYYKRLKTGDQDAAREWNRWDLSITALVGKSGNFGKLEDRAWCFTHALMESHYLSHGAFLEEGQLLADVHKMQHIPGAIVQGRYDLICPPKTAWDLHKVWPNSSLNWVEGAGHSADEPGIIAKLVEICDKFVVLE